MNTRQLYQWVGRTSKHWSGVTRHFRENVRVFSRGVVRACSSHIRTIAGMSGGQANSQRRRLQRFVKREQPLPAFFAGWTSSLLKRLNLREVVLVVDETKLKDQLGVMVVGVVVAGRCIPLAWRVYGANDRHAYPTEGQVGMIVDLLTAIRAGLPRGTAVRVLADRGIGTSPALMRAIMALGWTFLFRVTRQSKIVLADGQAVCFYDEVKAPGQTYQATGLVFRQRGRIPAQVRVLWGQAAKQRWALVTNDPTLTGWEYAQRMWIEEAFRDLKSHGWQVEAAAEMPAERMERLWIVLVVAYGWMLVWGMAVAQQAGCTTPKRRADGAVVRQWSLFREGRQAFLTALRSP
jgi:hypothetical protein